MGTIRAEDKLLVLRIAPKRVLSLPGDRAQGDFLPGAQLDSLTTILNASLIQQLKAKDRQIQSFKQWQWLSFGRCCKRSVISLAIFKSKLDVSLKVLHSSNTRHDSNQTSCWSHYGNEWLKWKELSFKRVI